MNKKYVTLMTAVLLPFSLVGCTPSAEVDNLTWTNSNAVYASVKAGYEQRILVNVEDAFKTLSFEKIYVTEKHVNPYTPLVLLFILNEKKVEETHDFVNALNEDVRINHARISRDLYFETIDTRSIEKEKDTISVGETLLLEMKGNIDFYLKPFDDDGLLIKPIDNKNYAVKDFPQINLESIEYRDNGWLYLKLANGGYFEVIKSANVLSRLSIIEKVELDVYSSMILPPIWDISDPTIAVFESSVDGGYPTATIKGISAGIVTISYGDLSCEITVIPIK